MGTPTPKGDAMQRFLREWGLVSTHGGTEKGSSDSDRVLDLHSLELPRPTTSTEFTNHTSHAMLTIQRAQQLAEEKERERERERERELEREREKRQDDLADSRSIFANVTSHSSNINNNNNNNDSNINIYSTSYHSNSHSNKAPTIASNRTKKSFGRLPNKKALPTAPKTTIASFGSGIQKSLFGILGKLKLHSSSSAETHPLPPLPAGFSSDLSPSATITNTSTSAKHTYYYPDVHTNFHDGLATAAWDERSLPPKPIASAVGNNLVALTVASAAPLVVKRRALPTIPIASNALTFDRTHSAFPGATTNMQKQSTLIVDIDSEVNNRSLPRIPKPISTPISASVLFVTQQTVNTTDATPDKSQTQSPPSGLPPLHILLDLNSANSGNGIQKDSILPGTSVAIDLDTPATPLDDNELPSMQATTLEQQQQTGSKVINSSLSFNDGDDSAITVADNRKSYSFVMGYDDEIEVGKLQQDLKTFDEVNAVVGSPNIFSANNREMAISPFSARSSRNAANTLTVGDRFEEISLVPRSSIPSRAALHLFDRNDTFSDNLNDNDNDNSNGGHCEYGYNHYGVSRSHQDVGANNDDDVRYRHSEEGQEGMDSLTILAKIVQQQHMNSKDFAS
ncbi:hypothetical protein HK100_004947 [Physocladia obscura]|uniref:Uncharacterized protein n=1 Tax=Physocladia obscura TaxID=109957 RepID=A0AAD5STT0_9FUNG|nr:hypothetical protein HK100_004947 [Physocladia obscura]